jgi:hypothetical protein
MDLVTLTDHNTISGALEIAHHPDVVIGVEATVEFPEDRVPVHVLAWGLDEARWADMNRLRGNLYELVDYMDGAGLPAQVETLIRDGLAELRAAGLPPEGFIAPAYAHPPAAAEGCRRAGLGWWATRASLAWEGGRRRRPSLGLGASTPSKRALSPAAVRAAAGALARAPAVRLDLHPADLRHPRLATAGRDLLERLLA